jgi:N-acetylmuramoyl-L-alanine amidase
VAGRPRYSAFPMYNPFRLVIDVETEGVPAALTRATPSITPPAAWSAPAADMTARSEPRTNVGLPAVGRTSETTGTSEPPVVERRTVPAPPPPPLKTSPLPAAVLSRGGDYSLARQLGLGVARVVIDAGHGGHDPGAQANGIVEADLVLDIALRVEKLLLEQPGVNVVLTRRTNEFIALDERTAIANREGADLFLSIHANASRRSVARGIETYFLNFATNPEAEAVAARENATSARTMGNLPDLVKTIALNNKVVESRELATVVQTAMVRRLRQQNKTLRDLGVKQAPFVVLIGAQMPSVLAEISFVTNKTEAGLLKQPGYRQRIAQSLADGVMNYQASLKKATTVAAKISN